MNTLSHSPYLQRAPIGERQPSVREVAQLLRQHIREVLLIALAVTALACAYAFLATPIYSADVLVRVDTPEANVFGIAPQGQVLTQPSQPPTVAEIAMMQSRSVIEPIIHKYKFDVLAQPRTVPVIGALAALLATPGEPAPAWFGLSSYAWGGEQIDVGTLEVPDQFEDDKLQLRALGENRYELLTPASQLLLSGTVGQTVRAHGITLLVNRLVAQPGTRFNVSAPNAVNTIRRFQQDLKITDDGHGTGVVRITFTDPDAGVATGVANGVAQSYIDAAVTSNQANDARTLAFLQHELPRLQSDLERAEAELSSYRITSGSMQPAAEAQLYLQGGIDFQRQIALLQIQRTQLLQRFMPESPEVRNVDAQLAQLNGAKHSFDARFSNMPASERKSAELSRNARVAESIYVAMVSKAEELSVRRAGTNANAHIVDPAIRPSRPVKPDRKLVIGGGMAAGLVLGIIVVFIRRQVLGGVIDPMYVEHYMSVPLFGAIGHSVRQARLENQSARELPVATRALELDTTHEPDGATQPASEVTPADLTPADAPHSAHAASGARIGLSKAISIARTLPPSAHRLLARTFPRDPSIESLRSIRTALRLEMINAANNIVTLTSATAGTGKSFVAANLAVLLAEAGSRVLLIDADMRCGKLAAYFSQTHSGGLAEVLRGDLQIRSALRPVGIENLTFMACGSYPANPSELLMMHGINQMLLGMEPKFDLVIVDTPPFLPVTDAAIVANQSGATVLVLRSGMQTAQELEDTVRGLDRTGAHLVGAIFNGVPARANNTSAYGYDAQFTYEERAKSAKTAQAA